MASFNPIIIPFITVCFVMEGGVFVMTFTNNINTLSQVKVYYLYPNAHTAYSYPHIAEWQ